MKHSKKKQKLDKRDKKGNILSRAQPIKATVTDGPLVLTQPVNVEQIRFRFTLNNAILYSFSFR